MPSVDFSFCASSSGGSDVGAVESFKSVARPTLPVCYLHWFSQDCRLAVWSRLGDEPRLGLLLRYLELAPLDPVGSSNVAGFVFDHGASEVRVASKNESGPVVPLDAVEPQVPFLGGYRVVLPDGASVSEVEGYGYVEFANRIHPAVFASIYGPCPKVGDARTFMRLRASYRVDGDGAHPAGDGGVDLRTVAPDLVLRDRVRALCPDFKSECVEVADPFCYDGFCYLQLYPEERRAEIARQVGEWPTLAQLPSGRFPAADVRVVGRVLGAIALHCSGSGPAGSVHDALAGYPTSARVGGGYADTMCANCILGSTGPVCSDCQDFSALDWRSEPTLADVERRFGTDGCAQYRRMLRDTCLFGGPDPCTQVLVLRSDLPMRKTRSARGSACVLEPGYPGLVPVVEPDGRRGRVSVVSDYWAVQFERGTRVEFGPYDLWCRQPTLLMGKGRADFACKFPYSGSWSPGPPVVIGFGLSRSAWVGCLHDSLGCDPTDATARLTTAVECPLYMSAWFDRSRPAAQGPVPVREWVSHDGAVRNVACAAGHFAQGVGDEGIVLAARNGVVTVGDLVVSRRGSVCVVEGPAGEYVCSWSCWDPSVVRGGPAGSDALAVAVSRGRDSTVVCSVGGADTAPSGVPREPRAVVMTVEDTYLLDSGGPSSDGEGGYTYGTDF